MNILSDYAGVNRSEAKDGHSRIDHRDEVA